MGWESTVKILNPEVHLFRVLRDGESLSFEEVAALLQQDPDFQIWFTDLLKNAPMEAYFWETPPVAKSNFDRDFEYVLVDAPSLTRLRANSSPFRSHFNRARQGIVRFHNLGKDAVLVAPVPRSQDDPYAHLAGFLRSAPQTQINSLWYRTFKSLKEMLSTSAIWVSTSGLGVAWVHMRLDSVPKYYNHRPYMKRP